jgi:hypothetical protein
VSGEAGGGLRYPDSAEEADGATDASGERAAPGSSMTCPVCPDGYASAQIGIDSSSPTGVSVQYVCWHGLEIDPPEWSVQARLQRDTNDAPGSPVEDIRDERGA